MSGSEDLDEILDSPKHQEASDDEVSYNIESSKQAPTNDRPKRKAALDRKKIVDDASDQEASDDLLPQETLPQVEADAQ